MPALPRLLVLGLAFTFLLASPVAARRVAESGPDATVAKGVAPPILINEIRIDQTSNDDDEYFELAGGGGSNLDGLTYLVIGDGTGGSGVVEEVTDLTGQAIPGSGFFVAAESTFTLGSADLTTALDFENSDNVTHLLVRDFTGASGDDLDTDDDGGFDTMPWSEIVDCVELVETVGSGDLTYCPARSVGPDGSFVPGHVFRCGDGFEIGAFSPVGTDDTPGAANDCPATALINEIRIDQTSNDDDEYFELAGGGGSSLDGLAYLVIGDGTGGSGVVEEVTDLTGSSIPGSGFFVAAESTFTLGSADLTTVLDFENSDNVTHLLVRDFTGASGDDLDTDDDGGFDTMPWSEIVDCVELVETVGSGDLTYCPARSVGPDGSFVPGHVFRCGDGFEIGAFSPVGTDDTPGAANDCPVPAPPALVINEVDAETPGSPDAEEFLEIYNAGPDTVDLAAFQLDLVNDLGTVQHSFALGGMLPAGGHYVVCANPGATPGCDLDVTPDSNLIDSFGAAAIVQTASATIVDSVSFGVHVPGYSEGAGAGFDSATAFVGLSRIPDGDDSDDNAADFELACITPGATNVAGSTGCTDPAALAELVINEIDYDQSGTDAAEFLEIKNVDAASVDLSAYQLELVNGSGGAVYQTFVLSGTLAAGDYFVVCANPANTPSCDLDVSPDTNLIQNGDPDAAAIVHTVSGTIVDTVSYDGDVPGYTETAGVSPGDDTSAFLGISRDPDGADTGDNDADFIRACITPGAANTMASTSCPDPVPPPPPVDREIWEIQGDGLASPDDGAAVNLSGDVVTAVGPEGFFLQTPTADSDGDPDTSDGIYVFTGGAPTVVVGDVVDLTGTVDEFFELTEINAVSSLVVTTNDPGLVPPPLDLATTISYDPATPTCVVAGGGDLAEITFECLEGMLVTASGVTASGSQSFGTDPIAEAYVVPDATRAFREPGIEFPGMPPVPVWDGNVEVFELDPDALGLPNVELTSETTYTATGVVSFQFGGYELWPSALVTGAGMTLPRPVRPTLPGEMTIGAFNVLRLFDEVDDPGVDDPTDVTAAEYADHRAELARYIVDVLHAPDVLGIEEVEKLSVLQDLAADVQALDPAVVYTAYLEEGNDIGGIDVGFLIRDTVAVDAVTQLGAAETLTVDGSPLHDRPSLLLEGRYVANGADFPLAVMVNHLRSLNGIEDPGATGDRVRQKRLEQAQSIAQKVDDFQDANPTVPLVLVGDFNAFEFSDGFVDVIGQLVGDVDPNAQILEGPDLVDPNLTIETIAEVAADERYSFIFGGSAQALDHALTTTAADPFVRGMEYGRGNVDAPEIHAGDPTTSLASSDHDGLVLFLMTDQDADGIPDDLDNCPAVANPVQENGDADSLGDACDNCPAVANEDQANADADTLGDVCDNCRAAANEDQANADADSFGDVCDNCPAVTNEDQADSDLDGLGDACDDCDPADPPEITVLAQDDRGVTLRIADCAGVTSVALGTDAVNVELLIVDGMLGDPVITVRIEVIDPALEAVASVVGEDAEGNVDAFSLTLGPSAILAIPTLGELGLGALVALLGLAGAGRLRRRAA